MMAAGGGDQAAVPNSRDSLVANFGRMKLERVKN
jgi:hypothetical protein